MNPEAHAQIADAVRAIIKKYQEVCPEAVIVLQGVFPCHNQVGTAAHLDKLLSKLAEEDKVIYLDLSKNFLNADGSLIEDDFMDGIHPNAKGYEVWATALQPTLDQYFPDLAKPAEPQ